MTEVPTPEAEKQAEIKEIKRKLDDYFRKNTQLASRFPTKGSVFGEVEHIVNTDPKLWQSWWIVIEDPDEYSTAPESKLSLHIVLRENDSKSTRDPEVLLLQSKFDEIIGNTSMLKKLRNFVRRGLQK